MLSKYFSVSEFEHSDVAIAKKISNKMNDTQKAAVKHFCVYVLDKIRELFTEKYGKVIIKVTSGFRGAQLNKTIGGSNTSQHCCPNGSAAADIYVYKFVGDKKVQIPPTEVYNNIKTWVKAGRVVVDQCIDEHTKTASWTHVSICAQMTQARKQFLKYDGKKYTLDK